MMSLALLGMFGCASGSYAAGVSPSYGDQSMNHEESARFDEADESVSTRFYDFDDKLISGELTKPQAAPGRPAKKSTAGKDEAPPAEDNIAPDKATAQPKRYIIYSAEVGLYVESVEGAHESVEALANKHNGWLKTSENTRLHIRVPAKHFDALLDELKTLGDVQFVNKRGQDVTEEFFDLEARLKNAEHMRRRYIELLAKAKNVQESLAIERELGRITETIERHKGRLKYLKNHIAFSTIVITLQPKPNELGTPERIALPFYWLRGYKIDALVR
jgi:hypothetical protein